MRRSHQHLLSALLLALWLAPSMATLGVGLHLALEHHGHSEDHDPHEAEHAEELADLAHAVAHGHHHDAEAAPDHGHEVAPYGLSAALERSLAATSTLPSRSSAVASLASRPLLFRAPAPTSPSPLFTTHCSLLL